jgi:hypothetical protein
VVLYVNVLNLLKPDTVKGILSDAGSCLYWYLLQKEQYCKMAEESYDFVLFNLSDAK